MSGGLKVDIEMEADLFILEHKINKYLQKSCSVMPSAPLVALVARELATNILKYGGKGFVILKREGDKLTISAEDEGIANRRGTIYKPKRGLGIGLDVTRKNCEKLDIEHKTGGGMVVKAVLSLPQHRKEEGFVLQVGAASKPHYLEEDSGDITFYKEIGGKHFLFVADVLGHGKRAGAVAKEIELYLKNLDEIHIEKIYAGLEKTLQDTRGCAAFLATVSQRVFEYVNVGNIKGWLIHSGYVRKLNGVNGVVGRTSLEPNLFKEIVPTDFVLIVCTDGIKKRFIQSTDMKWLKAMGTKEAAEKILQEFSIKEDDASILIARGGKWL
ncbi:SpoIIE family protein phosphatase [Microaerobacter geothermalis]|uniref:SpoIIE family protein phosphatase n=1 Tax=Microaerobacter geothermalis TaxID=674972 RepID=UPI001F441D69|nr:SpoIIE family protein phosphatase [Microaerobacter geothermalis]MCF6094371.1 SpoIIE family protein phosphatase [Microaerobacter geothermalis]